VYHPTSVHLSFKAGIHAKKSADVLYVSPSTTIIIAAFILEEAAPRLFASSGDPPQVTCITVLTEGYATQLASNSHGVQFIEIS
jgi:hypothetical protein